MFPKGKCDGLTGGMKQALRDVGLAQSDEEAKAEEDERVTHYAESEWLITMACLPLQVII
jgi:hypothetical protein